MKRACSSFVSSAVFANLFNRNSLRSQRRLLLQLSRPSGSSYFSTNVPSQDKAENNNNKPISFSLKDGNTRIKSAMFLQKVKEVVGPEVSDEEFIIPRSAFDALASEYDVLLDEVTTFKDKYTRALADTENVRRRGQRQVEEAKIFAIQGFCKDLLEVADILDLAVGAVKKEEVEASAQLKALHEGIVMTRTVLDKTFAKHGLMKLSPEGEKFDPNLHEAIFQVPKEQTKYEPGCVAQVMTIGYALQGRPVRAAKVGVVQSA